LKHLQSTHQGSRSHTSIYLLLSPPKSHPRKGTHHWNNNKHPVQLHEWNVPKCIVFMNKKSI
jgi:hypothetical protein